MKLNHYFAMFVAAMGAMACQPSGQTSFEPKLDVTGNSLVENTLTVAAKGTTTYLNVNSNVSYSITSDMDWVHTDPVNVANADNKDLKTTVELTVDPNSEEESRTATVKVSSEEHPALDYTFTVSQSGMTIVKELEILMEGTPVAAPVEVKASATTVSVMAVSTVSWTAASDKDWLTIEPASATIADYTKTPTTVTFSISENTSTTEARQATVTFTGEGVEPVTVTVNQAAKVVYNFEINVSDITYSSVAVSCTPSSPDVYYLLSLETAAYVNLFETDQELVAADMAYFQEEYDYYKEAIADFPYTSFAEFFITEYCLQGNLDAENGLMSGLTQDTEYVAYVYAVDSDANVISDVVKESVKSDALTFYGNATWNDVFVPTLYTFTNPDTNFALPCDVYTYEAKPGTIIFDSPFWYSNIAPWFGLEPEEMKQYTGNYRLSYIEIDCTDPDKVTMPLQMLGANLKSEDGWLFGGNTETGFGAYKDNTITFDGTSLLVTTYYSLIEEKAWPVAETNGEVTFSIEITPGGSSIKPATAAATANVEMKSVSTKQLMKSVSTKKFAKAGFQKLR